MIHALLVAGLAVTVLGAVVLPINLSAFPRLSRIATGLRPSRLPRVSVVVPARDEELEIERTVRSHLGSDYPDLQVVVVDDRSTDRTGSILESIALEDRRLLVVAGREPPDGWLGKTHALWLGADAADGEILLLADADVRYDRRTLREAVAVMERRGLDFVAFLPRFEMRGFWENVLIPYLEVAVFLGLGFLAALPRFRLLALGAGVGNLVRRRAYDAIGGHAAIRNSVVDDVRLAITVKRAGFRVAALRAEDRIEVRIYRGFRGVWNGFTKNAGWVYSGAGGAVLLTLTLVVFGIAIVPPVTLALAAMGAPVDSANVRLAAAVAGGTVVVRAVLASVLHEPLWPALAHPIMAAVWSGLLGRSLIHRFIRRRLTWRGREFDARRARF